MSKTSFYFTQTKTMTDILSGANETTLLAAWQDIVDLSIDVAYSIFNFFLDLVTTNAGLVVVAIVIVALFAFIRRRGRRIM